MDRKKILVVDDDPQMRLALQVRLRANQYDTIFAEDGVGSIMEARTHSPDLILLDLGLPAGDGFSVLERLNAIDGLSSIPVIVMSGRDRLASRDRSLKAGAKAFLQKPVNNAQLLSVMQHFLELKGAQKVYDLGQCLASS
jgi:DNA-binding response OmpR family regulator